MVSTYTVLLCIDTYVLDVIYLYICTVLDTAGQEEFSAMREQYMRKGDGFLIVFSLTDPQSFRNVTHFHTQILRVKDRDSFPVVLVGNKADLVGSRAVPPAPPRDLARRLRAPYLETSAKQPPLNVDAAFHELVRRVREQAPVDKPRRKGRHSRTCTLL